MVGMVFSPEVALPWGICTPPPCTHYSAASALNGGRTVVSHVVHYTSATQSAFEVYQALEHMIKNRPHPLKRDLAWLYARFPQFRDGRGPVIPLAGGILPPKHVSLCDAKERLRDCQWGGVPVADALLRVMICPDCITAIHVAREYNRNRTA
jgi:hypothetical protein